MLSQMLATAEPFAGSAIPSLDRLTSACDRVLSRWPDVVSAPRDDREAIVVEMLRRVQSENWEGATLASVIRAGRVVFEPDFRARRDLRPLREFYVRETEKSTSPGYLGAMMSIYLGSYEPGAGHSRDLARALNQARAYVTGRWLRLLENTPYLFDSRHVERSIGKAMQGMDDPWKGLKKMGFQNPHAIGLLYHAHLAYVAEVKPELRKPFRVAQMLGWLKPAGRDVRSSGAREAVEALLNPWKSREPPDDLRDRLIEGLVSAYGDPRIRRGGVWAQVHEKFKSVLLRWLTGANIQFFLDVVTEVEESHMWQPRREFWWKLYKQKQIDAAWVAFSPKAAITAKRQAHRVGRSDLSFGKQTAGGSRSNTSLLILKIGDCVVVEGSHSYKVHVFRSNDPLAPELFAQEYDCEQIRLAPGHREQAHHSGWERRVRRLIGYWS